MTTNNKTTSTAQALAETIEFSAVGLRLGRVDSAANYLSRINNAAWVRNNTLAACSLRKAAAASGKRRWK
jgi:hypothetical protein